MLEDINNLFKKIFSNEETLVFALLLTIGFLIIFFLGNILTPFLMSLVFAYLLIWMQKRLEYYGLNSTIALILTYSFFLLIGVYFQQKTYAFLSFERDYKSYFPISITVINEHEEEYQKTVSSVQQGDQLLIRHGELIPVDCVLKRGKAIIDYSFVTSYSLVIVKLFRIKIWIE